MQRNSVFYRKYTVDVRTTGIESDILPILLGELYITMTILLHSSKTMRAIKPKEQNLRQPQLIEKAILLHNYLLTLSVKELMKSMHLSQPLAEKTRKLIHSWTSDQKHHSLAIDTFLGDIYSGLHATDFTEEERSFADKSLIILSGLYGCIRPLDGISPYRLEMGYRLPSKKFENLYSFWGKEIVDCLPKTGTILNLSALEYSKTVIPFVDPDRVITPHFLTKNAKTGEPTFVVVHTKIARGAFARYVIKNKIEEKEELEKFSELGYNYSPALSTPQKPTFICETFGGIGLSIRLKA